MRRRVHEVVVGRLRTGESYGIPPPLPPVVVNEKFEDSTDFCPEAAEITAKSYVVPADNPVKFSECEVTRFEDLVDDP